MEEKEKEFTECDCSTCHACADLAHEAEGFDNEEEGILTFIDEEGKDVKFEILDVITMNDKEYLVVLPTDKEKEDEGVLILEIKTVDGEEVYDTVTDDKEAEAVFEKFQEEYADFDEDDDEDSDEEDK